MAGLSRNDGVIFLCSSLVLELLGNTNKLATSTHPATFRLRMREPLGHLVTHTVPPNLDSNVQQVRGINPLFSTRNGQKRPETR
ncbi:hypothetical protein LZ31DRAFT_114452 [Colletotrichum somersetense]|nr:hypothetical protein LZ31DRAFT_114452 [Colletotrichum somersetense]